MVRETRYLHVGNLPEKVSEEDITEHFKRHGKIQSVRLHEKKDGEDGLTATVAFTDIKSASKAHTSENIIDGKSLVTKYSEGNSGAKGSIVQRTHHDLNLVPSRPPGYSHARGTPNYPSGRKGVEEGEAYDIYSREQSFGENRYSFENGPSQQRGRPRERYHRDNRAYKQFHGTSYEGGHRSFDQAKVDREEGFERPKNPPSPSASHSGSRHSSRTKKKKDRSTSHSQSRSRSHSSSSSSYSRSSSGSSGSHSGSRSRSSSHRSRRHIGVTSVAVKPQRSESQGSGDSDGVVDPEDTRPHGCLITGLPSRSSDTSIRDGLFHQYKKYGKVNAVLVAGVGDDRYAIVSFKKADDAAKALDGSKDLVFFGCKVKVDTHEGIADTDDNEFRPPEAELDEYHPKATRTLFVGNLEKDITTQELKDRFSDYGEIIDIDVKRQGAVSAYAFVQYFDIASVVRALKELDGKAIGSMKIKLGFGKSMPTNCIWLDNVAESVSENFLCKQFSRYGNVSRGVIDKQSGKALVFFTNMDDAQFALNEMRNRILNKKKIVTDFASRECQKRFFEKLEKTGQSQNRSWGGGEGQWDSSRGRGSFRPYNSRGARNFQRGRGTMGFRSHGNQFGSEEYRRQRSYDDYSPGGTTPYAEGDDSYEQELITYSHTQRERAEQGGSRSPSQYSDDLYGEAIRRKDKEHGTRFPERYKDKYAMEYSGSPGSDHMSAFLEEPGSGYGLRYGGHERYSTGGRDGEHSPGPDMPRGYSPEGHGWSGSPSRSRQGKDQHNTPPTPTAEDVHNFSSRDHSPMDSDYFKGQSKMDDFDITEADIKEIQASHSGRKDPFGKYSKKRQLNDSQRREHSNLFEESIQKRMLGRSKAESRKDLVQKVQQIECEISDKKAKQAQRSHDSSSSSGCIDSENEMMENELSKLQNEKEALLSQLNVLENASSSSENENADPDSEKWRSAKRSRADSWQSKSSSRIVSGGSTPKKSGHSSSYMVDSSQGYRKQMEVIRKKEEFPKEEHMRRYKEKKSGYESDNEDHHVLASPHDIPAPFKRRKRQEGSEDSGIRRTYRKKCEEGHMSSDNDEVTLRRLSSGHSSPRTPVFPQQVDHHRQSESEMSACEGHVVSTPRKKEHKHRSQKDEMLIIPLGDDSVPNFELIDPRQRPLHDNNEPLSLPLPKFASYMPALFPPASAYTADNSDNNKSDSPCFSPPSSGSKQSDSSPNDSSGPSDSASGDILGQKPDAGAFFQEEDNTQAQSDQNTETTDSDKRKEEEEALLTNSDTSDAEMDKDEAMDIEERIRRLDEKLSQSSKIPPAKTCAEQLSPISIPTVSTSNTTNSNPIDFYSKYKIRKKGDSVSVPLPNTSSVNTNSPNSESKNGEPSDIVRTVLQRSSVFDQDSERLRQVNSGTSTSARYDDIPKTSGGLIRTKAAAKEMPMDVPLSPLPGSLADRLGNGGSAFPTNFVSTTLASQSSHLLGQVTQVYSPEDVHPSDSLSSLYGNEPKNSEEEEEDCHQQEHFSSDPSPNLVERNSDDSVKCMEVTLPTKYSNEDLVTSGNVVSVLDNICSSAIQPSVDDSSVCADQVDIDTKAGDDDGHVPNCGSNKCDNKAETVESDNDTVISLEKKELMEVDENVCDNKSDLTSTNDCSDNIQKEQDCPKPEDTDSELLPSGQGENEDLLKPKITENSMETKTDGDTVDKSAVPVDIKTETIAENSSAEKEPESSECSIKQENLDEPSGNSDVTLVSNKSESKPDGKHSDKETAPKGKLEVLPDKPKVKSEEDSGHGRKRKASPDNIESKPALVATKKEECSDSKRQKVEQIHSSSSVETCDKTEKSKEIKKEPDSVGKKLSSEAHHKDKKKETASEVENKKDRGKTDSSKDKNSHSKVKTSSIKQKETSAASKDSATKKEAHHSDSSHKHKSSSSSSSTSSTTSSSTKQVADKNKEAQNHGKKSSKDSSSHKSPKLEKSSSSESCNTKSGSEKTKDKDHVRNTTEKVSSKDTHNKDGEKPLTTHNKDGEKPLTTHNKDGEKHLTTHNKDGEKHLTTHNKEGEKPVVTHNKEGEKPAVTHNKEGEKSVASSSHNKEGEKSTSSNSSKKKKEPKKEPEDSCQNEADTHKGHPDKKDSPDKSSGADAPKPKLSKTSSTEKHKSSGSEKSKESHKHKSSDSGKSKSSSNDGPQKDKSDATSVKSEPVLNKPDSASVSKDKTNHGSHKEKVESKNKKDGTASQDGSKSRDKSVDKNKAEKSHKSKSGEPKHTQSSETKVKQEQNKDMKEDMLKDHQNDQTDKSSKSASKSKVKEEKVKGNGSEKNGTSCKDKERSNNSDKDKNNKNSDKASKSSHSSQLPDCNKTKSADSADKKEGKAAEKAKDSQKAPENHKSQQNSDDKANKSKDSTNSNSTEEKNKKSDKKEKKAAKPLVFSDEEGTEVVGKKSDQSKSSKKSSKDKYHNVKPEEETSKPPKSEKSKKSSSSSSKDNAKSKDITEEKTASKGETSKKEKEKKKQEKEKLEKEKQTASTKAPAADDDFDWAAWAEPAYESMYDKVKRRSTDKAKQQEMKNNTSKIMKSSDLDDIEESTDESSFSPTNKKGKKKLTKPKTSSAKRKRNSPYCTSSDDDDDEEYLKSLKKKTDFNKGKGSQSSKKKPIYSHVYSSDSEDDKTDDDFSGIKIPPKEAKKVKKRDDTTAESSEDIGAPKSKKNKSLKSSKKDKHSSTEKSSKKVKSLSLDEKEIKTKNEKPEDKPKKIGKKSKPLMSLFSTSEDETDDDILGRKSKDNNNKNNNFMNHLKKEELNYLHSESDDGDLPVFNNNNNKAAVSAASQAESEKDGEKQHSAKKKKKKTGSTESRTRTEDDSVGLFEKMDLFIAQKAEGKTDKKSSLSSESKASVVERKDSSESDSKVKSHKKDKKESKKSKKKDKDTKQKKKDLSGGLIDRTKENLFDELFNKNPISEKESSLEEELRNSKLQDMVHCTKTNIITACSANDGYDAIYRSDLAGNIAGNDSSSQDKKDGSLTKIKNIEEKDKQSESENNKVKKLKKKKKEKEKKENIDIKKSKKKNKDEQNHKEKKDKKKKKENQKSSSVTDCLVDDITRDMCEAPLFFDDIQEKELEVTSEQVSTDNNHSDLEPSEVLTESLVEEEVIAVDNQKKSVDKAPMSRKGRISSQETSNAIASLFDSFVTTSQETSTTEAHKSGAKLQSSSKTGLTSLKEPLHVATEDMHKKDIFDFQEEDEEDQSLLSPGSLRKRAETQKKESKKLQPTEEHAAVQKKERKKSNSISLSSDTELGTVKKEGNKEKKERKGKESKKDKKEREKKEKELKDKDPRSSNLNIHRFAAVIRAASQETKDPVHHDDDAPLTFDEPLFGKFISLHDTDKPKEDEKQENVMMSPEKKQKKKGSKSDETEEEKKSKDESAKESQAQVKKEEKEKVNVKEKDKDTLMLEAVSSLQNIEIDTKQPEQVEAEDETPKPELAEQSEDINEQATAEETENAVASILPLDDRTGEFIATEPTNETVLEEVLPPVEIPEEESTQEEEAKVSQAADHKPAIGEVSTVFSPPHKANAVANCLMSPPRDVLAHVPSSTPEHVQAPLKIFTSPIHKPEDLHPSPRNETVMPEFHASPVVSQANKLLSPKQKEAFFNNLISPPGNMHRLNLLSPKSSSEAAAQNPLLSPKLQSDSHSGVLSAKHDLPLMGNLVPLRQPHLQQQPLLHKHHFDHNDRRIFDSNLKQDQPKDLLNFNHMAAHALEQKAALAKKLSNDHFLQNRVEQQLINARAEIQTTKEPPISQLQQANINALMAHFGPPPEKLVETHAHKDLLLASRSFHESGQKLLNALPSAGQEMSKNIPVSSAPAHAVDGSQPTFAGFTNMYQQNPFNFKAGDLSSSIATPEEKSETPSKQTRKSRKPRTPKSKANVAESPQVILSESGEESLSQSAQQVMPSPMNPPSHTAPHPHQHHIAEQDSVRPPLMLHIGPLSEMSDQGSNSADSKVEDKRVTRRSNKEAAQRTSTNLSFEDITHTSEELNDGQDFFDSTTDSDRADEDPNRLVIDQNYPTEPKPRPRRDRKKQKNYREMNSGVTPRTTSPRSQRSSPRSPRNVASPKQSASPAAEIPSPIVKIERLHMNKQGKKESEIENARKLGKGLHMSKAETEAEVEAEVQRNLEAISHNVEASQLAKDAANVFDFDANESEFKAETLGPTQRRRSGTRRKRTIDSALETDDRKIHAEISQPEEARVRSLSTESGIKMIITNGGQQRNNKENKTKHKPENEHISIKIRTKPDNENGNKFEVALSDSHPTKVHQEMPNVSTPLESSGTLHSHLIMQQPVGSQQGHPVSVPVSEAQAGIVDTNVTMMHIPKKVKKIDRERASSFSKLSSEPVPTTPSTPTPMSNIDKIIDNVSKGIFEWSEPDQNEQNKPFMPTAASQLSEGVHGKKKFASRLAQDAERSLAESQARNTHAGYQGNPNELVIAQLRHLNADPHMLPPHENMSENKQGMPPPNTQPSERHTPAQQIVTRKMGENTGNKLEPNSLSHLMGHPYPMMPPMPPVNIGRQDRLRQQQAEQVKSQAMSAGLEKQGERQPMSSSATAPTCVVHPITTTAHPIKQDALKGPHDLPVSTMGNIIPHAQLSQDLVKEKVKAAMEQHHFQPQHLPKPSENAGTDLSINKNAEAKGKEGGKQTVNHRHTPVSAHSHLELTRPPNAHSHIKPREQMSAHELQAEQLQALQKGIINPLSLFPPHGMRASLDAEKKGSGPVDLQKIVAPNQLQRSVASSSSQVSGHHPQIQSPALAQTAPSPHQINQRPPSPGPKKASEKNSSQNRWTEPLVDARISSSLRNRPPSRDVHTSREAWMYGPGAPIAHQQAEQGINLTTSQSNSRESHPSPKELTRQETLNRQQAEMHFQLQQQQQQQQQEQLEREKRQKQEEQQQELLRQQAILRDASNIVASEARQTALVSGLQRSNGLGHPSHPSSRPDAKTLAMEAIQSQHGIPVGMLQDPRRPGAFNPAVSTADLVQNLASGPNLYSNLQRMGMLGMIDPHLYPAPTSFLPHPLFLQHGLPADGRFPGAPGGPRQPLLQSPGGPHSTGNLGPGDALQSRGIQDQGPSGEGSLLSLLAHHPVMWQGVLALKTDSCVVQMHLISGFSPLVQSSLPQQDQDGTIQPLRISQRMRLEAAQLDGVIKRMNMDRDYCMLLALPCGRDTNDIMQQTRAMSTGFIHYLQQKQAAGIVNVPDPTTQQPAFVVHIFPPCEFSHSQLERQGFEIKNQIRDVSHLLIVITTVA